MSPTKSQNLNVSRLVLQASNKSAERKKQQPVSAMFLFLEENRTVYKQKYPEMDHQELTRLLAKEFSALPDDKKVGFVVNSLAPWEIVMKFLKKR